MSNGSVSSNVSGLPFAKVGPVMHDLGDGVVIVESHDYATGSGSAEHREMTPIERTLAGGGADALKKLFQALNRGREVSNPS